MEDIFRKYVTHIHEKEKQAIVGDIKSTLTIVDLCRDMRRFINRLYDSQYQDGCIDGCVAKEIKQEIEYRLIDHFGEEEV